MLMIEGVDPSLIKVVAEYGGPAAVIVLLLIFGAALLLTKFFSFIKDQNANRFNEMKLRMEDHKSDKAQLCDIIKGNTEAMTKVCSAVDHCTSAIGKNTETLQDLLIHKKD